MFVWLNKNYHYYSRVLTVVQV